MRTVVVLLSLRITISTWSKGWYSLKDIVRPSVAAIARVKCQTDDWTSEECIGTPVVSSNLDTNFFACWDKALGDKFGTKAAALRCVTNKPGFRDLNIAWLVSMRPQAEIQLYRNWMWHALDEFLTSAKGDRGFVMPPRMIYLHLVHVAMGKWDSVRHDDFARLLSKVETAPPLRLPGIIERALELAGKAPGVVRLSIQLAWVSESLEWESDIIDLLSILFDHYTVLIGLAKDNDCLYEIERDIELPLMQILSSTTSPKKQDLENISKRVDRLKLVCVN